MADPSRASSNPFVALRRSSWPFVDIFLPFRGNPFSLWPLADPSRASSNPFVALRRSSWPFVDIFLPFRGNPFSPWRPMADPSRASSNPLVALSGPSWPFVDIFLPFRGNPFSPLASLLQPLGLVVLRGPSWIFLPFRGNPSRASSNPFVALRRSSWPFVDIFLPFPGNPFSPWRSLANPSRASSNPLAALSGPSCPFVDNSFSLRALRGSPSWISFFGLRHSLAGSSTGPSQDPACRLISARQSTSPSM